MTPSSSFIARVMAPSQSVTMSRSGRCTISVSACRAEELGCILVSILQCSEFVANVQMT